jgi:hypothetical protein
MAKPMAAPLAIVSQNKCGLLVERMMLQDFADRSGFLPAEREGLAGADHQAVRLCLDNRKTQCPIAFLGKRGRRLKQQGAAFAILTDFL